MPEIETSERFEAIYEGLPKEARKKIQKALRLLAKNPRHPSLQAKPVRGFKSIYEARVDVTYRMTYERLPDDVLLMRTVAKHDEALKNP